MCENHNIIMDWIDIDPDRSMAIYYCDVCYMTFDGPVDPSIPSHSSVCDCSGSGSGSS